MARRAELFVRELSDGEAAHLLRLSKRGPNAVVRRRAMLLFASFQGQSVSQIALLFEASATHVAALIHAFNAEGFAALDPHWGEGRPRRIDRDQRAEIVKVAGSGTGVASSRCCTGCPTFAAPRRTTTWPTAEADLARAVRPA